MLFKDILNDIEQALKNKCYYAATIACLTLPDICGEVEYPNKNKKDVGIRYKMWCREYFEPIVKEYYQVSDDMPWLSASMLYSLRCNLLHEGIPKLRKDQIDEEENKVNGFRILFYDTCRLSQSSRDGSKGITEFEVSAKHICSLLKYAAEEYYKNNREKFDNNYSSYNKKFETMIFG